MNFNDPSEFGRVFNEITSDPAEIRETFAADQQAEDEFDLRNAKVYQHPNGEHFEVAYVRTSGERVTTTGKWIPMDVWTRCKPVPINDQPGDGHA